MISYYRLKQQLLKALSLRQYITNGAMFGTGIYLGDRLGKSITYVGNDSYSMLSESDLDEDDADGIVMLSDYIQGANIVQGGTKQWWKNIPEEATCVLAGPSNSPVKAAEIVIRNNAQLCPRYLVDVSGRLQTASSFL